MSKKNKNVKELTDKELAKLTEVLEEIDYQYNNEGTASMFNYDHEYIDIELTFEDDSYEQIKLERELLSNEDMTPREIANHAE